MKRNEKYYKAHQIFTYGLEMIRLPLDTAKKLNGEFNLNMQDYHYSSDGTWYELINAYPAVLFDTYGYIIVTSENHLSHIAKITKYINIPKGIHKLSEYVKYSKIPSTIENYEKNIKDAEIKRDQLKLPSLKTLSLREIMLKSLNGASHILKI
jgi:hypothetical protein